MTSGDFLTEDCSASSNIDKELNALGDEFERELCNGGYRDKRGNLICLGIVGEDLT
jgi:hypothetical protein